MQEKLRKDLLERWMHLAQIQGVPPEAYRPTIRVITDPSNQSDFAFGVIHNSYRFERPTSRLGDSTCVLCSVVEDVSKEPLRRLDDDKFEDFFCVPNKFPITRGHTLAISKGIGEWQTPMYTTSNLDGLVHEMRRAFNFGERTGWRLYHNSDGAGASIPEHEHWHLKDFGGLFAALGTSWGFEVAHHENVPGATGAYTMPGYPFAHMILDTEDPERIVHFLRKMGEDIGGNYANGQVPHGLAQGRGRVLIVPSRVYQAKGIGAGDMAGNIIVKKRESLDMADYGYCMRTLGSTLFREEDLNLATFL